jgi:glycine cleavage system H protein
VKAAADLYTPISGQVVAVNPELESAPEKVNQDAYAAWLFRVQPGNTNELGELLDASAYSAVVDADSK